MERAIVNVVDNLNSTSSVDALSANQGRVLNEKIDNNTIADSGWVTLELLGNVQAYSTGNYPQCRKIGNVVYIRGAVKNVLQDDTDVCQLPVGYRPIGMSISYLQNTSYANGGANMARIQVGTNGVITIQKITTELGATYGATKWFPLNVSFVVD